MHRADNLTTFMFRLSRNLGVSTSWHPQGLSRPVQELLYLVPHTCTSLASMFFFFHLKVSCCKLIALHTVKNRDTLTTAMLIIRVCSDVRLQLKCDGTRWRTGGEVKGKLANGVGSQYRSHYLGTWCIQRYYQQ